VDKIEIFLTFDGKAEEALAFYQSVFPDLKPGGIMRYGPNMPEPEGKVLTAEFTLFNHRFVLMNAALGTNPTTATSFLVLCDDQAELDQYWNALLDGGQPLACGWITDKFGVTWQITPRGLRDWIKDPDPDRAHRVMTTMMSMIKLEFEPLRQAHSS
jgi:predicted 3-demethylubiquinone-9 3-methyltransferase (glyoxalase superfamily)